MSGALDSPRGPGHLNWNRLRLTTSGDFILTSLLTALILYTLSNRLLLSSPNTSSQPQHSVGPSDTRVELAYAFDVAVNSFFPAFLTLGGGGLVLASVIVRDNWVCLFFGK